MTKSSNHIITSFGSGFTGQDEPLYEKIKEIGYILAQSGWIVCSGGYYGSMEAISKGVKSAGGRTIGITVKGWDTKTNEFIDEEVKMPNIMERIVELIGIADAYIIFKGGTGTLVEISTALELMNKKIIPEKPMIFYTDFWLNVINTLRQDSKNLSELIDRNIKFINDVNDLSSILN